MTFDLSQRYDDRYGDMVVLPLLKPTRFDLELKSAMTASSAWLAAAQMLLVDAQNEIRNLALCCNDSKIMNCEPCARDCIVKENDNVPSLINISDEATINLPLIDSDSEFERDDEVEFIAPAGGASEEEVCPLDAKVGSSLEFYLRQLRELKVATMEEEQRLVLAAQSGHLDAINHLVSQNLKIVPSIARTYAGRGLPLEDLIEEGNLGLYRAIPRFDLSMGHRFATYARWWVKHEIRTAVLNQGRLIRLPVHIFKALSRVRRQLESVGQAMPYATRDPNHTLTDQSSSESLRLTLAEAQSLLRLTELPLSLDMPFEDDFENSLIDTIPGELDSSPESCIQQEQRARHLTNAIQQLALNEREVVMRRYGFLNGKPESLDAIGKCLKLTAERVRQIQKKALLNIQQYFLKHGLSLSELL
jgi:RNA polymerase nonessential primary-like sigma factor